MKIKWYYFYTKDYEYWNKHLSSNLAKYFSIYPIQLDNINVKEKIGTHHFDGVTKKIELIIEAIQNNLGNKIIFSDCTLFFNNNNLSQLQNYMEANVKLSYDLILADNNDNTYNICLMMINCNIQTLSFFNSVKKAIETGYISWDQKAINDLLLDKQYSKLSHGKFDSNLIVCDRYLSKNKKKSFYAYKQFIAPINKILNWNFRIGYLYSNGLISYEEYSNNILEYDIHKYPYSDYIGYLLLFNFELFFIIIIIIIFVITIIYSSHKKTN